jgi:2-hydroxychromene-2-carboxylate isomerase
MATIEYFYAAHSIFAYLGSAKIQAVAKAAGRRLVHKPFNYQPVIETSGAGSTRNRSTAHRAYYFGREVERWAEWRNVPVMKGFPTHHWANMNLASGILIAAAEGGMDVDRLSHGFLQGHWCDDADLSNVNTLTQIISAANLDSQALLNAARTPKIKGVFQRNTDEAIERSVFGSPTYFIDGDMFYGQDCLELVERGLQTPFAGTWPRD